MIINLVPEFLSVCAAKAPDVAYREYLRRYETILSAYWHNYVLDLGSPHADEVIRGALAADRRDLHRLVASTDIERVAADAVDRAAAVLELDVEVDLYLTVGVGCTGGRHRSVTLVEMLRRSLGGAGLAPVVRHRDIDRE